MHEFYKQPSAPPMKIIFLDNLSFFIGSTATYLRKHFWPKKKKILRHHPLPTAALPLWPDLRGRVRGGEDHTTAFATYGQRCRPLGQTWHG